MMLLISGLIFVGFIAYLHHFFFDQWFITTLS